MTVSPGANACKLSPEFPSDYDLAIQDDPKILERLRSVGGTDIESRKIVDPTQLMHFKFLREQQRRHRDTIWKFAKEACEISTSIATEIQQARIAEIVFFVPGSGMVDLMLAEKKEGKKRPITISTSIEYIAFEGASAFAIDETAGRSYEERLSSLKKYQNYYALVTKKNSDGVIRPVEPYWSTRGWTAERWEQKIRSNDDFRREILTLRRRHVMFVLSHEIAHHALDHWSQKKGVGKHPEFEADIWAVRVLVRNELQWPLEMAPAFLLFHQFRETGLVQAGDHPSPRDRFVAAADELMLLRKSKKGFTAEDQVLFSEQVEMIKKEFSPP
jgi:hypothetical protein